MYLKISFMKNITKYLLLLITTFPINSLLAQQDLTLYNMEVVPQRMYANPAFFPSYSKVNIGLPMLSSQYINFSNSGFKYSDLVKHRADDSLYIDYDGMLDKLKDNNYLTVAAQPDILSFGFTVQDVNYFSFNITEKVNFRFRYPKGLMEFIGKGNGGLLGQEVAFNLGVDFIHYREYGFGYSRIVNDKLTVGGKLKYLYGMENVWTEDADLSLTTDANDFSLTAKSNFKVNTSLDTNLINGGEFSASDYAFKKKNKGLGIDLGGVYKLNEKISVNASIIDLGFIKWKEDVTNYQSNDPNATFTFSGMDMNDLLNDTSNTDQFQEALDSIAEVFKIDTLHNVYRTSLSTQIYLGGNYYFTEKMNVGAILYGQFFDKKIHPALSLSFNQRLGKWLNYSLSYSMYNRSYNNIGLGIGLNLGPVQLYVVSDNILGAFKPQNTKNIHLHAGINLTFGRGKEDKDKNIKEKDKLESIVDQVVKEEVKDQDKDGIVDSLDVCPEVVGLAELMGCPDKDGDKVADHTDSCPDIAGLVIFNGCPDTDEDGISDNHDACPDKKGPESNNGCPIVVEEVPVDTLKEVIAEPVKVEEIKEEVEEKAAEEAKVIPVSAPIVTPEETKVELKEEEAEIIKKAFDNLEFETGKNVIKNESYSSLNELASLLDKKNTWKLKVSGHTDNQGDAATNMVLSEKRAVAVKMYLIMQGIAPDRIKVEWFGATKPIADNATEEGRQKNRRVEMLIFE